jgi:D-alanyl-D-alanine dipeptidase
MKWDRSKGRPEPIAALNKIVEIESGEPMVDMELACPNLVKMRPTTFSWCRKTVAEMVEQAARSLPKGVRMGYVEAWRPFERQKAIFDWMWEKLEEARPGLTYSQKRRIVCRWVAPIDQKAPPGHCTGAALDVYLLDPAGDLVDVISPFSRFQATATYTLGLSDIALANRSLLVETMTLAGFSNCRDEYWHYSFGDAGWAVRTGHKECQYGLVEVDESVWREAQDEWMEALPKRQNPFLN